MKKNNKSELLVKKIKELQISGTQTLPLLEGFEVNPNIPTHHVNIANIMASSDGMVLISFFTRIPGHNIETCRVAIHQTIASRMVDIMCQQLNYYPNPSSSSKPKETKK